MGKRERGAEEGDLRREERRKAQKKRSDTSADRHPLRARISRTNLRNLALQLAFNSRLRPKQGLAAVALGAKQLPLSSLVFVTAIPEPVVQKADFAGSSWWRPLVGPPQARFPACQV